MGSLNELISLARSEEGYVEKVSNKNLDSKTGNRGTNNYTKYSRDVNNAGLRGCQGQAWCATSAFWLDLKTFGVDKALQLWNMNRSTYVGYSCFSTYNVFAACGKVGKTPKLGALVVFTFSHMGRVLRIYTQNGITYFDCWEGNTSSNLNDRNGGMVKIKKRRADDSTIKGFCYIDYDSVTPEIDISKSGWVQEDGGWRFYLGNINQPIRNDWYWDGKGWCFFDDAGFAVHDNWYKYKTQWYYFGSDCYALKSTWLCYKDKHYYIDSNNVMAASCYVKSKDPLSQLYYWVNEEGIWEPEWNTTTPDLEKYRIVE